MLRAEKLAEIGQLAAGVAHEIRNPLAGIRGAIEVLRENKIDSEVQRPIMTEILERVDRLNTAVQDLLEYAKPMSPHETRLQLSDVLDSTLSTLLRDPRLQGVEIVKDYQQAVDVETDVSIIERVFTNIILNAAQAMNFVGKLADLSRRAAATEALVSFRDTGPGIESGVLGKIFSPFFTTRSEGSGLGLDSVQKVHRDSGGQDRGQHAIRRWNHVCDLASEGTRSVISGPRASCALTCAPLLFHALLYANHGAGRSADNCISMGPKPSGITSRGSAAHNQQIGFPALGRGAYRVGNIPELQSEGSA